MKAFEPKFPSDLFRELWVTLTARELSPDIYIMARSSDPSSDVVLTAGDTLITIGHQDNLEKLLNVLQPKD